MGTRGPIRPGAQGLVTSAGRQVSNGKGRRWPIAGSLQPKSSGHGPPPEAPGRTACAATRGRCAVKRNERGHADFEESGLPTSFGKCKLSVGNPPWVALSPRFSSFGVQGTAWPCDGKLADAKRKQSKLKCGCELHVCWQALLVAPWSQVTLFSCEPQVTRDGAARTTRPDN